MSQNANIKLQPTELVIEVSAGHFANAKHGTYENPVALALNDALEAAGLMPAGTAMIAVAKGYALTSDILDKRASADSYDANSAYHALLFGQAVRLPRTAQMVLSVFGYGPSSGLFAVRDKQGTMVALRPYRQIVQPFTFSLSFLAPTPSFLPEAIPSTTDFISTTEEIFA